MIMRAAALLGLLALAACAPGPSLPEAPLPVATGTPIQATPVALNPENPKQDRIGDFVYAGGLVLTSTATSRFHGLSDLRIGPNGKLTAVSDEADLLEADLILDRAGAPVGLNNARLTTLADLDGKPIQGKAEGDSEGLAILASGDRLVSFEGHHRVWLYPADGAPPREAPFPAVDFPPNGGMEALSPYPSSGPDAYLVGHEETGQTWICRVVGACVEWTKIAKPAEFGLVAAAPTPDGAMAYLLRAWDPLRGSRVTLVVYKDGKELGRMDLARPYTVDNLEGIDAVPGKNGATRFYLLSDDNFQSSQRTLLLAFDWKPAP